MRILLADDDPDVLIPLEAVLRREGYDVLSAGDGERAWAYFTAEHPDFVVLDVNMPGIDGVELTRRIARIGQPHVPIILLTGRQQERDKVLALELGADDYVVKPCSHRELLARIRAVWRRAGPTSRVLRVGDLVLDTAMHQVSLEGQVLDVTANEFVLLRVLIERAGQVVRTNTIMHHVWGGEVTQDLLRVTIYRLRHKLEADPKRPRYIHTIHGIGLMIRDGATGHGTPPL